MKMCGYQMCRLEFEPTRGGQREQVYCSPECRSRAKRDKKREQARLVRSVLASPPPAKPAPARIHAGRIGGDSRTADVFRFLARYPGRWYSAGDINDGCKTTCGSTWVSSVRRRLAEMGNPWRIEVRVDRTGPSVVWRYRAVKEAS